MTKGSRRSRVQGTKRGSRVRVTTTWDRFAKAAAVQDLWHLMMGWHMVFLYETLGCSASSQRIRNYLVIPRGSYFVSLAYKESSCRGGESGIGLVAVCTEAWPIQESRFPTAAW